MSCPLDPVVLLNVLEPILDKSTGGVREIHLADRFVNVMRDARKLVQRCVYLNIFQSTRSEEIRKEIIRLGAWDILYDWLRESDKQRHWTVVADILRVFISLSVSIDLLRSNGAPKLIKRLSKRQEIDSDVRDLATDILSIWKDIVLDDINKESSKEKQQKSNGRPTSSLSTSSSSNSNEMSASSAFDPNIEMEEAEEPYSTASSSTTSLTLSSVYPEEGKSAQNKNTHLKVAKQVSSSNSSPSSNPIQHPPTMTKLGGGKTTEKKLDRKNIEILKQKSSMDGSTIKEEKDDKKKITPDKKAQQHHAAVGSKRPSQEVDAFGAALALGAGESKRPKTTAPVKTYRTTFRSTGLDQDPEPSTTKKRKETPNMAAVMMKQRKESSLTVNVKPKPAAVVGPTPRSTSSDSNFVDQQGDQPMLSPTSIMPGAIVVKSAKPGATPKAVQLIESDSFMAALAGSSQPRTNAVIRRKKISNTSDPPSTAKGDSQPPTTIQKPQFYKEIVRSGVGVNNSNTTDPSSTIGQHAQVGHEENSNHGGEESNEATAAIHKSGNGKKRVRWAKENELVRVQYFELEEGERLHKLMGGVNKNSLASLDKKFEREAMEAARSKGKGGTGSETATAEPETYCTWKLTPCENALELVQRGYQSEEKKVQVERMKNVLAEIYFTPEMIPDTPREIDLLTAAGDKQEAAPPRIIPLDDVAVPEPEPEPFPQGPMGVVGMVPPVGPGGPGGGGGSLPPELARLIQNLNKSGILPTVPPSGGAGGGSMPPMGMGGGVGGFVGNQGPGFGGPQQQQGFGMGQPVGGMIGGPGGGIMQQQQPQPGPFGPMGNQQQQGMRPMMPGMQPQIPNAGGPPMFNSQMLNPQAFAIGNQQQAPPPQNWNGNNNNSRPPPNNQNGDGGFRGRGGGVGGGWRGNNSRFQGPPRGGGNGGGNQAPSGGGRLCQFFLRGSCHFGDKCRLRHEEPGPPGAGGFSSPNADTPSSPPPPSSQSNNRDEHRDRERGDRGGDHHGGGNRSRFRDRSPPRFNHNNNNNHRDHRDRDHDRRDRSSSTGGGGDMDMRKPRLGSEYHQRSPTYPRFGESPTTNGTGAAGDSAVGGSATKLNESSDSIILIPDTPASP